MAVGCGQAQRAEELLEYMEKSYRTGLHPKAKPDGRGYVSVIQAYTKDGGLGAALKAEKLLSQMKQRYMGNRTTSAKPSRHVYNAVSCRYT